MRKVVVAVSVLAGLGLVLHATTVRQLQDDYLRKRERAVADCAREVARLKEAHCREVRALLARAVENGEWIVAAAASNELARCEGELVLASNLTDVAFLVIDRVETGYAGEIAYLQGALKRAVAALPPGTNSLTDSHPLAPPMGMIEHAAIGARVTASSTHLGEPGESTADALVDGDLFTRWSSNYEAPQEILIHLAQPTALQRLRLHWELASALRYGVHVSEDGKSWRSVYLHMQTGSDLKARVDEIDMKGVTAAQLRIDLQRCINPAWGFSLYEIELQAAR